MSTISSSLTIREAAARLGVHESTVRRYADRGLIGVKRLPSGVRRLSEADVEALRKRIESGNRHDTNRPPDAAPGVTIEELAPVAIWESDEELDEFLLFTYEERDRDR